MGGNVDGRLDNQTFSIELDTFEMKKLSGMQIPREDHVSTIGKLKKL